MFDPHLYIDAYHDGTLTPEEITLFEQAMAQDADLRTAVKNYDAAKKLSKGLIEIETRQILESISTIEEPRQESSIKKYVILGLVLAAAIAGLIWFMMLKNQPVTGEHLYATYYKPPIMAMTTKGQIQDSLLSKVQASFNAQAYAESIKKFHRMEETSETNFYRALAYQAVDEPDSSLLLLESIKPQTNDIFWYRAMVNLKQNNLDKAEILLSRITKGSVHFQKSQEILKQIQ